MAALQTCYFSGAKPIYVIKANVTLWSATFFNLWIGGVFLLQRKGLDLNANFYIYPPLFLEACRFGLLPLSGAFFPPHFPILKPLMPWFAGSLFAPPCCISNPSASGGLGVGDHFLWQAAKISSVKLSHCFMAIYSVSCRNLELLLLWEEIIVLEKIHLESVTIFFWSTYLPCF